MKFNRQSTVNQRIANRPTIINFSAFPSPNPDTMFLLALAERIPLYRLIGIPLEVEFVLGRSREASDFVYVCACGEEVDR